MLINACFQNGFIKRPFHSKNRNESLNMLRERDDIEKRPKLTQTIICVDLFERRKRKKTKQNKNILTIPLTTPLDLCKW